MIWSRWSEHRESCCPKLWLEMQVAATQSWASWQHSLWWPSCQPAPSPWGWSRARWRCSPEGSPPPPPRSQDNERWIFQSFGWQELCFQARNLWHDQGQDHQQLRLLCCCFPEHYFPFLFSTTLVWHWRLTKTALMDFLKKPYRVICIRVRIITTVSGCHNFVS